MLDAKKGSLAIVEDFFGGEIGHDVSVDAVHDLSRSRFEDLRNRLKDASWDDQNDVTRAKRWEAKVNLPITARMATSETLERWDAAHQLAAYADSVVCSDPLLLVNTPGGIAHCLPFLIKLRPLIDAGIVLLCPRKLGWQAWNSIQKPPLPSDVIELALNLMNALPSTADGEMEIDVVQDLLGAFWLELEPVAVASRRGLLHEVLTGASLAVRRENNFAEVLLPSFHSVPASTLVKIRSNLGAFAEVRSALERVGDQMPTSGPLSQTQLDALFNDVLRPSALELRRELKNSPTVEAMLGTALTVGATAVSVATDTLAAGGVFAAASAPAPLLLSWLRTRRSGSSAALASRVLLELSATDIPYALAPLDRRPTRR